MNFDNTYLNRLFHFIPDNYEMENSIFDTEVINTSTENEFRPIINYNASYFVGDSENNLYFYYSLKIENIIDYSSRGNFLYITNYITNPNVLARCIRYKEKGVDKVIYVGFGFILDEVGNILFLAAYRNRIFNQHDEEEIEVTNKDVKIFITTVFMNEHRRVYNAVKKGILQSFLEGGCELSISNSKLIKDVVYGNEFERLANFETVEDKLSFIEEFRNTILE